MSPVRKRVSAPPASTREEPRSERRLKASTCAPPSRARDAKAPPAELPKPSAAMVKGHRAQDETRLLLRRSIEAKVAAVASEVAREIVRRAGYGRRKRVSLLLVAEALLGEDAVRIIPKDDCGPSLPTVLIDSDRFSRRRLFIPDVYQGSLAVAEQMAVGIFLFLLPMDSFYAASGFGRAFVRALLARCWGVSPGSEEFASHMASVEAKNAEVRRLRDEYGRSDEARNWAELVASVEAKRKASGVEA